MANDERLDFLVPQGSPWVRIAQNWQADWRWRTHNQTNWQSLSQGSGATCWIHPIPIDAWQVEVRFSLAPRGRLTPPSQPSPLGLAACSASSIFAKLVQIQVGWSPGFS